MFGIALIVIATATPALAEPSADIMQAHALVGRWLDAQNQHVFDAYIALYGDDFQGTKRTVKGTASTLNLAQWKADRAKMFRSGNLTVEAVAEQYNREPNGGFSVMFTQIYRSGTYSDQGRKALLFGMRNGSLRIVAEKLADVSAVEAGVFADTGSAKNVAEAFPRAFAQEVAFELWPCTKKGICDANLTVGPQKKKELLGKLANDADGEFGGSSAYRIRSFEFFPFGILDGAVLVTADKVDRENTNDLDDRVGAILGQGPEYRVLWSGEMAYVAGKDSVPCRVAVVPDAAPSTWDVVRSCGSKQTVERIK